MALIPEGTYEAHVIQVKDETDRLVWAQWGKTKTGKHQIYLAFEITQEGQYQGRKLPWYGYFTDRTFDRTLESLTYCGFEGDDLATLTSQKLDKPVEIVVEHEEVSRDDDDASADPILRARIRWINEPGGGSRLKEPLSEQEVNIVAAQLRTKVKQFRAGKRAANQSSAPPAPSRGYGHEHDPGPSDDDLPF